MTTIYDLAARQLLEELAAATTDAECWELQARARALLVDDAPSPRKALSAAATALLAVEEDRGFSSLKVSTRSLVYQAHGAVDAAKESA